jgi:integrase
MDVRFHDLRHTHGTRLAANGFSLAEVGRILGHRQPQTTYRYVNASNETLKRAASMLDDFNKLNDEGESPIIN